MTTKNIITPRKLAGFMELMPSKQVLLDGMKRKIEKIYSSAGFMPLDTPVLELGEILFAKSGGSIDKEVYAFKRGDSEICMRYDLTVPLARFVAMNSDNLTFPFKRFQIGKVFRGEKAQKGRFREFIQCDADIIGLDELPIVADAECLYLVDEIFKAFNLKILNRVSNRNILFGYCEELNLKEKTSDILIVLDKLDKIGGENVLKCLSDLGIEVEKGEKLLAITSKKGDFEDVISSIENLSQNETFQKGVNELKELSSYINAYGIDKNNITLDLSIIRGHNYYTGTVFEAIIPSHPEFGTVAGGGRYDNLAEYFTDKKLPGVGLSIGLTRLFDLLDQNNMLPEFNETNATLEIIPLGDTLTDCIRLQSYFSKEIKCQVNYSARSFKSKMKEANKKGVPYIIVVGENEVQSQQFALKNMTTGQQNLLSKEECLEKLKNI